MSRFRMPAFNHPTCSTPNCGAHFYPRRKGPCIRAELIIPAPGKVEAAVYRRLGRDGTRTADMAFYDGAEWTKAPLPRRPRKAHAPAVARARDFLKTGVWS